MSIQTVPFLDVFEDESGGNVKTPQSEYLPIGEYPVVDQGKALIAGYVDDKSRLCGNGRPAIVFGDHTRCVKYADFPFCMGADGVKVLRPKIEADLKYLYYFLNQLEIPNAGYDRHYKYLKRTEVVLQPLPEQRRIAAILDQADALRAKRREALAQLDSLTQSIFIEMFGDPVSNPKNWSVKPLSECAERIQIGPFGTQLHEEDYIDGGVPLINPTHLRGGVISPDSSLTVSPEKYTELSNYYLLTGDLIMGRRGEMGRCAVITNREEGWLCGTGSLFVRPKPDILSPTYLGLVISSPSMRRFLENVAQGVTMANLNKTIVGGLPIAVPPMAMQQAFVSQLNATQAIKNHSLNSLAELDALFASVQHRAFRGEL